ncbi:hypothetical protein D910_03281 [Dendroctonus ponderosae]|uniref:Uncharacterized protein n=1 Tax=Dendroctonus ponderosae TaxID=77166 RepID=U4U5K3_DENPD|nr:hypothetical protein D910_03281 [Dendroctonus ponderosae]
MDLKQRQILLQQNNHPSITPHTDSDSSDTMYLYEERLSDYEKDKGSKEKVSKDNTNGQIVSKASNGLKPKTSQSNQTKKKSQTDNEELLKVLEGSEDPAPTGKSNPSVINSDDKIADGIESSNDLNEDNIGLASSEKEAEYIEDIIIGGNAELVDDDRDNAADQQEAQKKPVAIKCVESTKNHSVKRSIDTPGNNNSVSKKSRIDTEAGVEVYYPILFSLVNMKSKDLYMKIFSFVHENLAPQLKPQEIISDYEANLYYALCIVYEESSIGGSMFYFIQNIYKKICSLNLARELELNANFRSIYNMILMLPLLPVNTILDGFSNIEFHARELDLDHLTSELFRHVRDEWIIKVTPEFFCVHRLENRINENMVGPFKKLRDLLMLTRSKSPKQKNRISAITTIEKLIELDTFLSETFQSPLKQTFGKDNSSNQKKAILRAWNYIEIHPMINIHQFFQKVLGYIKCMESQVRFKKQAQK